MLYVAPAGAQKVFLISFSVADATGYEHNGPFGLENEKFFMSFMVKKNLVNPVNPVKI